MSATCWGSEVPSEPGYVHGPADRHWNERANGLVADQLASALESSRGAR